MGGLTARPVDMSLVLALIVVLLIVAAVVLFEVCWRQGMTRAHRRGEWYRPWERRGRHTAGRVRRRPC